jgi:diamine N-acetyltransferase
MIQGKILKLRAVEPEDIDLMYTWENDMANWMVSGTVTPFSRKTMQEFIANAKEDIYTTKQLRLAIDLLHPVEKRNTVGYIDLYDFDPTHHRAGVGILIAENESRRNGYGIEALNLLCKYAFEILHLHQLYCHVHVNNTASINLFTSAGFVKSGEFIDWTLRNGEWLNVYFMQKIHDNSSL